MTESTDPLRYPTAQDESFIVSFIPEGLHQYLGAYIASNQNDTVWMNFRIMSPEYSDSPIERGTAALVLGFISMRAKALQSNVETHGLALDVLPEDVAMDGLRSYYEHLRTKNTVIQKNYLLEQLKNVLRTKGRNYAEPYVLMLLGRDLRQHGYVHGLTLWQREHLLQHDLQDVTGAIGAGIQPFSISKIKKHHQR